MLVHYCRCLSFAMNSLRECVTCKDVKDTTYLLPCLHPTCSQCVEDIVQDAKQNKRKLPGCRDCGEPFVQDKLTTVPSNNSNSTSECAECGANATHFCRDCHEYFCKPHGEPHSTTRRFKGHVVQLVVEVPFCNKHSHETALGFCTHCKVLICGNCTLTEHNKSPHVLVTLQEAVKSTADSVKSDVAKLLESIPAIDKEIKKHSNTRTKLEKERTELEAKIADIRKQEKVTTLQIEDLEKTKALLLTTQTQANALVSTATELPHATLLRLQNMVTSRVSKLQSGLHLMPRLESASPSIVFDRVSKNLTVSNNSKTITKVARDWGYGIGDGGCSTGVRSWRIAVNSIDTRNCAIMFGIWNSSDSPSSNNSFNNVNAWLVYCYNGGDRYWKAGSYTILESTSPLQSGDIILLTVDADQRRLTVSNTCKGWTHTVNELPPPKPSYFPYILVLRENESVTITAAS